MKIYFDPTGSPVSTMMMEDFLRYCAWSINLRTSVPVSYEGLNQSTTAAPGDPVVRWVSPVELKKRSSKTDEVMTKGATLTRADGKCQILLNTLHADRLGFLDMQNKHTIIHELMHVIIAGFDDHLDDKHAVMHPTILGNSRARYALSMADYMTAHGAQPEGADWYSAELTQERDLYIPDIEGHRALLKYIGDGVSHQWKLKDLSINPQTRNASPHQFDPQTRNLMLASVKTSGMTVRDVKMVSFGDDQWLLDSVGEVS
jgi:hypothetical protein